MKNHPPSAGWTLRKDVCQSEHTSYINFILRYSNNYILIEPNSSAQAHTFAVKHVHVIYNYIKKTILRHKQR